MAVPDFQSIMLPLLSFAADGKEHSLKEPYDVLATEFALTDEDLNEMLPSGVMTRWTNRVAWAKSYFTKMGIFESPRRGIFVITDKGRKILAEKPKRIDLKYLKEHFPKEFAAFHNSHKTISDNVSLSETSNNSTGTPEEIIEAAYLEIKRSLANELLQKLTRNSPSFFERTVIRLLVEMGYGGDFADAASVVGKSHDGGIDGIIKEDRLGLDKIYVQAKRYEEQTIGTPKIREFVGALHDQHAKKGIFITTSTFSQDAQQYAQRIDSHIVLIDGESLSNYMIDFNVGVSVARSYQIKRIDEDFFDEDI